MSATFKINATDRTAYLKWNSLKFRRGTNQRYSLSCQLEDNGRGFTPTINQSVQVLNGATVIFAGFVTSIIAERYEPGGPLNYKLEATDNNLIADRRIAYNSSSPNSPLTLTGTAGNMVRTLMTASMGGEGLSNSGVLDGPTLSDISVYYETCKSVLDKIAAAASTAAGTGWRWRIDESLVMNFTTYSGNSAPFNITYPGNVSGHSWRKLTYQQTTQNYRNQQFARTEQNITETVTETFTGNGTTRDFFVGFVGGNPYYFFIGAPTATLDTGSGPVALSLGRLGTDSLSGGYGAFYDATTTDGVNYIGGDGIHFIAAATPTQNAPPAGSTLAVTYKRIFGNVVKVEDTGEQATYGVWGNVDEQRNIDSSGALTEIATGDLSQFGHLPKKVVYETDEQGLTPGMIQHVTLSYLGLNDDFLIDQIETDWIDGTSFVFRHRVMLTNIGPAPVQGVIEKLASVARIGIPSVPNLGTSVETPPAPSTSVQVIKQTLTANLSLAAPTSVDDGQEVEYQLTQNATGGWVVTWASDFKGVSSLTVIGDASTTTIVRFKRIGSSYAMLWNDGGLSL